jgi:hypothetical protein
MCVCIYIYISVNRLKFDAFDPFVFVRNQQWRDGQTNTTLFHSNSLLPMVCSCYMFRPFVWSSSDRVFYICLVRDLT